MKMRTGVSPYMYSVHYVCIMCGKIAAVTDSVNRKLTATVCVTELLVCYVIHKSFLGLGVTVKAQSVILP